jgi:3-dehydroquinate synthase
MNILSSDRVTTETNSYDVVLSENFSGFSACLSKLESFSKIFVITEKHIADLYYEELNKELRSQGLTSQVIFMDGKEKNKHISKVGKVYNQLIEHQADRKSLILALGGGIVGDFSGFIAATLQRGIRFVQIPTTLLAAVDSSVGGKVAVNADLGKNMIGAFHQPDLVFAPLHTLQTLPKKEWKCGFAEVLKHSLLSGGHFFEKMKKITRINSKKKENIQFYIRESVRFKSSIVSQDPKEKGLRAVLNLGHTMGHAIESYLQYKKLTHGEAVSIGLVTSLLLSERILGLSSELIDEVLWIMKNLSLPFTYNIPPQEAVAHMKYDKKNSQGDINYVLLKNLGNPIFGKKVSEEEIQNAIQRQNLLK